MNDSTITTTQKKIFYSIIFLIIVAVTLLIYYAYFVAYRNMPIFDMVVFASGPEWDCDEDFIDIASSKQSNLHRKSFRLSCLG